MKILFIVNKNVSEKTCSFLQSISVQWQQLQSQLGTDSYALPANKYFIVVSKRNLALLFIAFNIHLFICNSVYADVNLPEKAQQQWQSGQYLKMAYLLSAPGEHFKSNIADQYKPRYQQDDGALWAWFYTHYLTAYMDLYLVTGDVYWQEKAKGLVEKFISTFNNKDTFKLLSSGYQKPLIENASFEEEMKAWTLSEPGKASIIPLSSTGFRAIKYFNGKPKYKLGELALKLGAGSAIGQTIKLLQAPYGLDLRLLTSDHSKLSVSLCNETQKSNVAEIQKPIKLDFVNFRFSAQQDGECQFVILNTGPHSVLIDGIRLATRKAFSIHLTQVSISLLRFAKHQPVNSKLRLALLTRLIPELKSLVNDKFYQTADTGQSIILDDDKKPIPMNWLASSGMAFVLAGELIQDKGLAAKGEKILATIYSKVDHSLSTKGWWNYREGFGLLDDSKMRADDLGHSALVVEGLLFYLDRKPDNKQLKSRLRKLVLSLIKVNELGIPALTSHLNGKRKPNDWGAAYVFGWMKLMSHADDKILQKWKLWMQENIGKRIKKELSETNQSPYYLRMAILAEELSKK